MLATGNAAVTEVANRQVAERPEARESGASGSPFAGLMAHWFQPQVVVKPPEKAPSGSSEPSPRKTFGSKAGSGSPSATPAAPPVTHEARSALKPRSPKTPAPTAAPAQPAASASALTDPASALAGDASVAADNASAPIINASAPAGDVAAPGNDSAPSANGPAASDNLPAAVALFAGTPVAALPVTALPAATADSPDPASMTPAPDQLMAALAAQALSVLQAGSPSSPRPSSSVAVPPEAAKSPAVPGTTDLNLDPVAPPPTPKAQAVLAEDPSQTKGKASTRELQAALEALPATPPMAAPAATKQGLDLPLPPVPQGTPAATPTKASAPAIGTDPEFAPSQVDAGAPKLPFFPRAMEGVPAEALPAPAANPMPQNADSSAMAAIAALPRATTPVAGSTPTAPPPNTPAQSSPLVTQVAGGVRWMLQGGSQEAQLQLHPDSLGQVTIHLRVEGGEVHARLWVTEASSVQAVQDGRPQLEASLKEQGLQLGSFDLQQGHRPFQDAPATPTYPEQAIQAVTPAGQEAPFLPATAILNARHVELYA